MLGYVWRGGFILVILQPIFEQLNDLRTMKKCLLLLLAAVVGPLMGGAARMTAEEVPAPNWNGRLLKSMVINSSERCVFKYDDQDRLTTYSYESEYGDKTVCSFAYSDNQMSMTDGDINVTVTIENGRVTKGTTSTVDYSGMTIGMEYDDEGRVTRITRQLGSRSMIAVCDWDGDDLTRLSDYNQKGSSDMVLDEYTDFNYGSESAPLILQVLMLGEFGTTVEADDVGSSLAMFLYGGKMPQRLLTSTTSTDAEDGGQEVYNFSYVRDANGDIVSFTINDTSYELEWGDATNPTGIEMRMAGCERPFTTVWTLSGQCVFTGVLTAERWQQLPAGVYVMDGRKVCKP